MIYQSVRQDIPRCFNVAAGSGAAEAMARPKKAAIGIACIAVYELPANGHRKCS